MRKGGEKGTLNFRVKCYATSARYLTERLTRHDLNEEEQNNY